VNDLLSVFVAPGLDGPAAALLVTASFFTSMLTATLGLGGGVMMIALMSVVWPATVAVPVHGVVQFGSNVGRSFTRRAHLHWRFIGWFTLGGIAGSIAGGHVAASLPDHLFKLAIGCFVLYAAWGPKPKAAVRSPWVITAAGVVTSALGMLVGGAGPLVAGLLQGFRDRREIIGTHALLMSMQHVLKTLVFVGLGFVFTPYVPLLAAMIASGFAGTLVGGRLLDKLPERSFRIAFRIVLTLIALDLVRRGLSFYVS